MTRCERGTGVHWHIFKDEEADYMPWVAQPECNGEKRDPRRFHSLDAVIEHVRKALS